MPGSRIGTLSFRSGTYAVSVGLPILPSAAVGAAVVEIEPAAIDMRPSSSSGARGARRGRRVSLGPVDIPTTGHIRRHAAVINTLGGPFRTGYVH